MQQEGRQAKASRRDWLLILLCNLVALASPPVTLGDHGTPMLCGRPWAQAML